MKSFPPIHLLKNISFLLILPFGFATAVYAQDKTDEETKSKASIRIITNINGDTKVIEKTFDPSDTFVLKELNDSFPELNEMVEFFADSPAVFAYKYEFDLDKDMKKLGEEMEKIGKGFHFEWNSEDFEKDMEGMGEEIEKVMKEMKRELHKKNVIDGDKIQAIGDEDENVWMSENGDTIKISVKKKIDSKDFSDDENGQKKRVKVIVIEEEVDEKEKGEEPEIKVIKKVIKKDDADQSTGLNDVDEGQSLHVFPNPTSGKLTINFKPDGKKKTHIKVMDDTGKIVYEEEVKSTSEYNHEIDLGNEAKGVYIVEVLQGKNKFVNRLMLK